MTMCDLSPDEQSYLIAAFAASPREWFRPRTVERQQFSDRAIDTIVESLARLGLIDGQPDSHARLTDQGRKEAAQLGKLAKRDWRKFYRRRRLRIIVALVVITLSAMIVILKQAGVI